MKLKRSFFKTFLVLVSVFSLNFLFGEIYEVDRSGHDLTVSLHMDKTSFAEFGEIPLKIRVVNTMQWPISFTVYENPSDDSTIYTTFQPIVYDMNGKERPTLVPYRLENKTVEDVIRFRQDKRVIELMPGDMFAYTVDLKKLYRLNSGERYRVRSYFLPDIPNRVLLYSVNELSFSVYHGSELAPKPVPKIEREILPSETVKLFLIAEKENQWQRMIKYVNLHEFINSYPEFVRMYSTASPNEKPEIIQRFVRFLSRPRLDYLVNFRVTNEIIMPDNQYAYVYVNAERFGNRRNQFFRYRYGLERVNGVWEINSLEATEIEGIR